MKWIALILLVVVMVLSTLLFLKFDENKKLEEEIYSLLMEEEKLYIDGEEFSGEGFSKKEDGLYIDYKLIEEKIYNKITLSNSGERIYVEIMKDKLAFESEKANDFIKSNIIDVNIPLIDIDGIKMASVSALSKVVLFDYGYAEGRGLYIISDENRLAIDQNNIKTVYIDKGMKFAFRDQIGKLTYAVDLGNSYFVAGTDFGYVSKKDITVSELKREMTFAKKEKLEKGFYFGWEQFSSYGEVVGSPVEYQETGLEVISPTFMELNINGIVLNMADTSYVEKAKAGGLLVHGLVSNSFNPDWTKALLENKTYVNRFISQLMLYSYIYDYDGINMDFENIYLEDSDGYTALLASAKTYMDELGLTFSVDVTVPGGSDQWSKVYDRANIQEHVDYVMLMAYDEYWASSPVAGPVASYGFTEKGVLASLETIPAEKLVLGINGYTRVWSVEGKASSKTLSYKNLEGYVSENTLVKETDSKFEMPVYTGEVNDEKVKIWVEDEEVLNKKLNLMNENSLAGVALWRVGFIDSSMSEVLSDSVK